MFLRKGKFMQFRSMDTATDTIPDCRQEFGCKCAVMHRVQRQRTRDFGVATLGGMSVPSWRRTSDACMVEDDKLCGELVVVVDSEQKKASDQYCENTFVSNIIANS